MNFIRNYIRKKVAQEIEENLCNFMWYSSEANRMYADKKILDKNDVDFIVDCQYQCAVIWKDRAKLSRRARFIGIDYDRCFSEIMSDSNNQTPELDRLNYILEGGMKNEQVY